MKILHVLPHLSGGGAERQFAYLASALVRANHEVCVAYLTTGPSEPYLPGVSRFNLRATSNYDPRILTQLVKLIQKNRPDVIHTWIVQMDILGGLAAQITGVPWVLREPSAPAALPLTLKRRIRSVVAGRAAAIVANSLAGTEFWRMRQPTVPVHLLRNGVPVDEIQSSSIDLTAEMLPSDSGFFIAAGRLVKSKRLDILIDAFGELNKHEQRSLLVCGEGPERASLEELAERRDLSRVVKFIGAQRPQVLWSLMKRAIAYVSMSEHEGSPNTVLEAMVCGCPLILSPIPAHRELIDSNSALFCENMKSSSVVEAIRYVTSNRVAASDRASHARIVATRHSIESMRRAYEIVYEQAIKTVSGRN